ncbi:MAG: endonuclease/exonuclease/phosphatase family protein [Planctomycetes bacterium]|nr:endonuclease/exonuclease/phosphatase family protein [Planctomycetota bacterium]
MSHFRVQYLVLLLTAAGVCALARRVRTASLFAAFALLDLAVIVPFYVDPAPLPEVRVSRTIRGMLLNVCTRRGDPSRVLAEIVSWDPDFVVLEEIDEEWLVRLAPLAASHPHSVTRPRPDNFGIGLFSRIPFARAEIVTLGAADPPSVLARFDLGGRALHVFGTHPVRPGERRYTLWRDEQLERIAEFLAGAVRPVLVLGDLNVTPWSCRFSELLETARLSDTARGRGVQATWPVDVPLLRIPVDHCLCSEGVVVEERWVGSDVGSDHFPLIVDFHLSASGD